MSTQNEIKVGDFVEILSLEKTLQPQGTFDFRQFGVVDVIEDREEVAFAIIKPKSKRKTITARVENLEKIDEELYKEVGNYPSEKNLKLENKPEEPEKPREAESPKEIKQENSMQEEPKTEPKPAINIEQENDTSIPPILNRGLKFGRNSFGLLESVDYIYDEDGSINWRALIPNEFLYVNKSYFERYDKQVPPSIEGLSDDKLSIKLGGIKYLAKIRGFDSVNLEVIKSEMDHATVKCSITWVPNYETQMKRTVFEEVASAHIQNTDDMSKKFLESIAFNRAFVRCVRGFLNINIVGDDEIDKSPPKENKASDFTPNNKLEQQLFSKKKIGSVSELKDYLRESHKRGENKPLIDSMAPNIKKWSEFGDISAKDCRILIGMISS